MQIKNLVRFLSAILTFLFVTHSYTRHDDITFELRSNRSFDDKAYMTLSGPDHGNKFNVQSIPDAIFEHVSIEVIQPDPWDSPDWHNNRSDGPTPFEDFIDCWSNIGCGIGQGFKFVGKGVGKGFKIAGKGIGKGVVFVAKSIGKGGHYALEGMCDGIEWTADKIENFFDSEEQQAKVSAQTNHTSQSNNKIQPDHKLTIPTPTLPLPSPEQAQAHQRAAMEQSMQEQEPDLKLYREELCGYLSEIENSPYQDVYNRGTKRLEAFKEYKNNQQLYQEQYTLSHEVTPFMERHSLDVHSFEVCYGNAIQQHLHVEILEILTSSCEIERIFAECNESPLFSDLVAEGADLARECNTQGDVKTGFKIADYLGWLNEAEYPRLANVIKQTAGVVVGAAEGGINIVKNTYNIARHPWDTTKSIFFICGQTGKFLFHGVQELGPFALHLSFHATPEGYRLHPHFAQDINAIKDFYNQIEQELQQLPPEERTRKITAFCTELYFTGKFMGQLGKIKRAATASIIKPGAISVANKLQLYKYKAITQTYTRIASTIANTQDIIKTTCKSWLQPPAYSYEFVFDQAGNGRWLYDINPACLEGIATECASLVPKGEMRGILQRTSMTEIIKSTIQENAIELLPGIAEKSVATMIEYAAERDQLQAISRKLIESGPMKGKYLKIKIDHLFTIDPKSTNQVKGFHHDFLGYLESTNAIKLENIRFGKFGEYIADVIWNGKITRDKTFFPKHWTREKVLKKVVEAYDNFIASKVEVITDLDGKYHIDSYTNEGLKIHLIIDTKCNVKTAYPII